MAYNDPAWEEWDRKQKSHYETKEAGWTTVREAREMENEEMPVIISPSGSIISPSGKKRPKTQSEEKLFMSPSKSKLPPVPESPSKIQYNIQEIQEIQDTPKKGRTIKSKVKSQLRKIKSEQPAEIVDVELEAARKKGYDAHKKDQRARELKKAEKQGRRDAMTTKSKIVEDVGTVAEKMEPVGKRVAKNVGKLLGEAKYTAKAATKAPARIAAKTTTTKPQTQRKAKPGPAVRKGTLGRHEGGLPVKSHKSGPGRRAGGLPVKSTKPGPGTRSKHGPVARSGYKPPHKSTKPTPTNNIPKTATVNKKRSVNFAMRARSKK